MRFIWAKRFDKENVAQIAPWRLDLFIFNKLISNLLGELTRLCSGELTMIENSYCYVSLHCVYIIISENITYLPI